MELEESKLKPDKMYSSFMEVIQDLRKMVLSRTMEFHRPPTEDDWVRAADLVNTMEAVGLTLLDNAVNVKDKVFSRFLLLYLKWLIEGPERWKQLLAFNEAEKEIIPILTQMMAMSEKENETLQ